MTDLFVPIPPAEPDEFTRLHYDLAIGEELVNLLSNDYDSGTEAPPPKVIESSSLPMAARVVPLSSIAEFRAKLIRYNDQTRAQLNLFQRVKVETHEFGRDPAKPTAKATTTRRKRAKRS